MSVSAAPARLSARTLLRALLPGALAIAAYILCAFVLFALGVQPVAAMVAANLVLALGVVLLRTRSARGDAPQRAALGSRTALAVMAALALLWICGQLLSLELYELLGSASFDAGRADRAASHPLLLIALLMLAAPLGEEAIMRGAAYPGLRRALGPYLSAALTAGVFALLHGNLVQLVLTVPMGMVLAGVMERTGKLRWCVLAHMWFNLFSLLVPAQLVIALVSPLMAAFAAAGSVLVLIWILPALLGSPKR